MKVFVTGTGTDVGKTVASCWLCLHTGSHYFKPLQTGNTQGTDSQYLSQIIGGNKIVPEKYSFKSPVAPYLAAHLEGCTIKLEDLEVPNYPNLVVEGAGGLLVPINDKQTTLDLIKHWQIKVILVARSGLGTINHTLLSLECMKNAGVTCLGVIINGEPNFHNKKAIEHYGNIPVLAEIPKFEHLSYSALASVGMPLTLKNTLLS